MANQSDFINQTFFSLGFIIPVRIRTRLLPLQCLPMVSYPFSFFNPSIPSIHTSVPKLVSSLLLSHPLEEMRNERGRRKYTNCRRERERGRENPFHTCVILFHCSIFLHIFTTLFFSLLSEDVNYIRRRKSSLSLSL